MLTSQMPALTRALSGVLPPNALKQLTQALGNCNQEVTHRGPVSIVPDAWQNVSNKNGTYDGFPPSVENYNEFYNEIVSNTTSNVYNVNSPVYNNVTRLGDVITVLGGRAGRDGRDGLDGIIGRDGINGIDGRAGRDGTDGMGGVAGPAGPPGAPGIGFRGEVGPAGPQGAPGPAGPAGRDGRDGVADVGLFVRKKAITFVTGGTCELSFNNYEALVGGHIDPDSCGFVPEYEMREELVSVKFVPETKTDTFFGP